MNLGANTLHTIKCLLWVKTNIVVSSAFKVKKNMKDKILILPVLYFLISISILFLLVLSKLFGEKFKSKQDEYPLEHFPDFFKLTSDPSNFYLTAIMLISLIGIINVWFFCSMLLQRFSVPELRHKKISVHFMFILGIFANIIFVFFAFSPEILKIESIKFRNLKISLSLIVFLIFIVFNIMFSIMSTQCISVLNDNSRRVRKNRRLKNCVIYLTIFVMLVYVIAINLQNNNTVLKGIKKIMVNIILLMSPYALFIFNAFMNLFLYSDLVFIKDIMSQIMEKDYFLSSEETERFIT